MWLCGVGINQGFCDQGLSQLCHVKIAWSTDSCFFHTGQKTTMSVTNGRYWKVRNGVTRSLSPVIQAVSIEHYIYVYASRICLAFCGVGSGVLSLKFAISRWLVALLGRKPFWLVWRTGRSVVSARVAAWQYADRCRKSVAYRRQRQLMCKMFLHCMIFQKVVFCLSL